MLVVQLLSEPQIEHAKIKFDEIDTDDSGNVDLKELKKVFKSLGLDMKQTTFNKVSATSMMRSYF